MKRFALAIFSSLIGGAALAAPVSSPYSSLIVIGDSLSDTGNAYHASSGAVPASPPYHQGRFSNGPIWADLIAEEFEAESKPVFNAAFGGARVIANDDASPDLLLQLLWQTFNFSEFGDRPLAAMWLGANDLFAMIEGEGPVSDVVDVVETMAWGLDTLKSLSFDDLVLLELPNLGAIPRYLGTALSERATLFSNAFNQVLRVEAARAEMDGTRVDVVPLEGLFETLLQDPGLLGMSEVAVPCLVSGGALCSDPETYVFFDHVHPSAGVHAAIADAFRAELTATAIVPISASLPFLATGILILFGIRRR